MHDTIKKELCGEPQEYILERTHNRDLRFIGWLLGKGAHGKDVTVTDPRSGIRTAGWKGIEVSIYVTVTGKYVVYYDRFNAGDVKKDTEVCEDAQDLLTVLESGGKAMPPASKQAWSEAVKKVPQLQPLEYEEV